MRKGESEQVVDVFKNQMDANLVYVDATDRFLGKLVGVAEPEAKRKTIGAELGQMQYRWMRLRSCSESVAMAGPWCRCGARGASVWASAG